MAIRALVIPWQKATSWQMPISRTWQEHQHLSWFLTPYNSLDFGVNQDRGSSIESLNQHLSNKKRIIEILYHRSHIWITFRFLILIWLRFPPRNAKINSNLAHLNCPFWIEPWLLLNILSNLLKNPFLVEKCSKRKLLANLSSGSSLDLCRANLELD